MSDHPIPEWLTLELASNHRDIEVRWMPYGPGKVFVLPVTGDAFYRMPIRKLSDMVMYRRYIAADTALKWKLQGAIPYFPEADCVSDGRFVVFQKSVATGHVQKLFDVVNDDGSLMPLDRRVIQGIQIRDGKFGAQEKAIADVEASADLAEVRAQLMLEEALEPLLDRMYHDIKKVASEHAGVTEDPTENDVVIH